MHVSRNTPPSPPTGVTSTPPPIDSPRSMFAAQVATADRTIIEATNARKLAVYGLQLANIGAGAEKGAPVPLAVIFVPEDIEKIQSSKALSTSAANVVLTNQEVTSIKDRAQIAFLSIVNTALIVDGVINTTMSQTPPITVKSAKEAVSSTVSSILRLIKDKCDSIMKEISDVKRKENQQCTKIDSEISFHDATCDDIRTRLNELDTLAQRAIKILCFARNAVIVVQRVVNICDGCTDVNNMKGAVQANALTEKVDGINIKDLLRHLQILAIHRKNGGEAGKLTATVNNLCSYMDNYLEDFKTELGKISSTKDQTPKKIR